MFHPCQSNFLAIFVFQDEADNAFFSYVCRKAHAAHFPALQMYEEKLNSMMERVFIPCKNR